MKRFLEDGSVKINYQDLSNIFYFEKKIPKGLLQAARESVLKDDRHSFSGLTFTSPLIVEYLRGIDYIVSANDLEPMDIKKIEEMCINEMHNIGECSNEREKVLVRYSSHIDALWNKRDGLPVDTPKMYLIPSFYERARNNLSGRLR